MELSARATDPATLATDCLIVPVGEGKRLPAATKLIDNACGKLISRRLENKDFSGKCGSTLMLHEPTGIPAKRLLLVGLGNTELTVQQYIKVCQSAAKAQRS